MNNNNNNNNNGKMSAGFNSEQIACVCEALQQANDMEVTLGLTVHHFSS